MGTYDDIIHLPYYTSPGRPRMPMIDRAAQFSLFAALVGHGAVIEETARLTNRKIKLSEEEKAMLDEKLRLLLETDGERAFTWFLPVGWKDGGAYVTTVGTVKKINLLEGRVPNKLLPDFTARITETELLLCPSACLAIVARTKHPGGWRFSWSKTGSVWLEQPPLPAVTPFLTGWGLAALTKQIGGKSPISSAVWWASWPCQENCQSWRWTEARLDSTTYR